MTHVHLFTKRISCAHTERERVISSRRTAPCLCASCVESSSLLPYSFVFIYFFFFSSRRRHTRCSRDWSSDVCSSDLTLANLEAQLGVKLFDRSSRSPVLTKQGVALLAEARAVVSGMDVFKARAKGLSDGLEPELSVVVDVMFPLERLTSAVAAFQAVFPATPLTLHVEALGAVLQPVMEGRCAL